MSGAKYWVAVLVPPVVVTAIFLLLASPSSVSTGGWIGVGFLAFGYAAQVLVPLTAPRTRSRAVFGLSFSLMSSYYLVAVIVLAILGVVADDFSWKWLLVLELIAFGFAATIFLGASALTDADGRLEERSRNATVNIQSLTAVLERIAGSITEPDLAKKAKRVAEQMRYAPIIGTRSSAQIDADLSASVEQLRWSAEQGDTASIEAGLTRVDGLIVQRAQIIQMSQ